VFGCTLNNKFPEKKMSSLKVDKTNTWLNNNYTFYENKNDKTERRSVLQVGVCSLFGLLKREAIP
jgi:hypothetical protein